MTENPDPTDQRFEHLLREQMPPPAPDELSDLVYDLRREYAVALPPEVQNRQIAAMVAAGRKAAAGAPGPLRRSLDRYWYRFSQRFIAGSLVSKVVLAASFAAAATTGVAATGHLPSEIQLAVSRAAAGMGVSIPAPEPQAVESQTPEPPPAPKIPAPGAVPSATAPPAPPVPVVGSASPAPTPSTTPSNACAGMIPQASPAPPTRPGNPDLVAAIGELAEEQLQLDALLECLVPPPGNPRPAPAGELGSAGLSELLERLLKPQA